MSVWVTEEYLQQVKPEELPSEDDLDIIDYQGMGEIFQTKIGSLLTLSQIVTND